ncbi:hypothetical protein DAQ1742_00047 [Dickeya aquatica]|uniref:Uncharacterized protein n=1 Tax=Dickeya aquatica TaxID=1401087 RepID=A0A375A587_9GAMM|nr:hypothetical protein DAQ1742_00047 [Dickeya aquatica]
MKILGFLMKWCWCQMKKTTPDVARRRYPVQGGYRRGAVVYYR